MKGNREEGEGYRTKEGSLSGFSENRRHCFSHRTYRAPVPGDKSGRVLQAKVWSLSFYLLKGLNAKDSVVFFFFQKEVAESLNVLYKKSLSGNTQ